MKKIFLTLAITLSSICSMQAQESLLNWLSDTQEPGAAVGQGADMQSARLDAVSRLYDHMTFDVDSASLLVRQLSALDMELVIDQKTPWVEAAVKSPFFTVVDTLVQDSLCWMRVKVTPEDLSRFHEQLKMVKMMQGSEYLIRAHFYREQGNLFGAAQEYSKGLRAITPCIHQSLVSDILEGEDLAFKLLFEYVSVFDSIQIASIYEHVPVVCGEEMPIDLKFKVTQHGKPVLNMPIQGWIDEGRMTASATTDAQGIASVHINKAPEKPDTYAGLIIHSDLAAMLEENFARPILARNLGEMSPSAKTLLVPFNPVPTYSIQLDSADIAHYDSLSVMLTRAGMIEADSLEEADLVCTLDYKSESGAPEKHGDYMLSTTHCSAQFSIKERATGKELANYAIPHFYFTHPSQKRAKDLRSRTMELMMRQVVVEMPAAIKDLSYDKRKVVYGKVPQ